MGGIYWLASYPKSGNTWFRAVLKNFQLNSTQPADINALATGNIASNRIWVDSVIGFDTSDLEPDEIENLRPHVYRWEYAQSARIGYHKIHDAYSVTGEGRPLVDDVATLGALYFLRNPLDVAVSFANHRGCSIDLAIRHMANSDYVQSRFTRKLSEQLPHFMGTWSHHVESWVGAPGLDLMILRYEDMHADPVRIFADGLAFIGLNPEPERLARAIRFSRFDEVAAQEKQSGFRERPVQNRQFFRKGIAGDWRNSLSDGQVARIIADHGTVMARYGYLDARGNPT